MSNMVTANYDEDSYQVFDPSTDGRGIKPVMATSTQYGRVVIDGGIVFATLDKLGQSYVDAIAAANPNEGKMRVRYYYGNINFTLFVDSAVPLPDGKWLVHQIGQESFDGFIRHYGSYIATRSFIEGLYLSNSIASESGVINVPAPAGGGWMNTTGENAYASVVGDTLSFSFYGTGFDLLTYCDNRGGAWSISVDGVSMGQITTWRSVAGWYSSVGPRGLSSGSHSVVLTFVGADGTNTPSAGGPRGWISRSIVGSPTGQNLRDRAMVRIATIGEVFTNVQDLAAPGSNIEAVIDSRKVGAAYATQKWPWHGIAGSTAMLSKSIYIDGAPINLADQRAIWFEANRIDVMESFTVQNPSETTAKLFNGAMHAIQTADGYEYKVSLDVLQDIEVTSAYGTMCGMYNCDRILWNNGISQNTSSHDSTMYGPMAKVADSGLLYDPAHNYALAYEIIDWKKSTRAGRPGNMPTFVHVQSRSDGTRMTKAYNYIAPVGSSTWYAGERIEVSGRFRGGVRPSI